MLQAIVGPPMTGVADLKSKENPLADKPQDLKKAGSDSFSNMLKSRDETKSARTEAPKPIREKTPVNTEKVSREDRRRPEESDLKAEKLKATDDKGTKKAKGNSQRQDAILNFMDSFESEFGVPPTRIVEAMANLQPNDQAEAPELTADQVIDQLGLDDQQEDQAKEMYIGLLAQLARIDNTQPQPPLKPQALPEQASAGAAAMTGAMAHERFASTQEKRQILDKSLDDMNQKFWMKGEFARPVGTETPLADKLAQMSLQDRMMQPQGLQVDESFSDPRLMDPAVQAPQGELQQPLQDIGAQQGAEGSEQAQSPIAALAALVAAARAAKGQVDAAQPEMDDVAMTESASSVEAPVPQLQAKGESVPMTEASAKNQYFANQQQQQQSGQEGFNSSAGQTAKGEMQAKTKSAEKADFKKTLGLEGVHQQMPLKAEALAPAGVVAGAQAVRTPTPGENEANVRQIMNQAQYLIKKGGGEMKVQMTPEGMGPIHMKVVVQDGKVNVQMAAETAEAKKTLESGLSDLKNSLAAHKLSMDHVKVDVVNSTNTDNSAQQNQMNDPGSRDQTRQFWNRFSENFGAPNGQRDNFTDIPNLRGYKRPRTDQALEPLQSAGVKKYAAAGKGKGLDLVA